MYLIFNGKKLIGYSYDDVAIKAFKKLADFDYNIARVEDSTPFRNGVVKTPEHIKNLVAFYKKLGYEYTAWKYIQYNRQVIPHFRYDFMEKFEETYNDILIDDINSSLDELLDSKVLPEY